MAIPFFKYAAVGRILSLSIATAMLAASVSAQTDSVPDAPPDMDGDLIPDSADAAPLVANLPVLWSLQSVSLTRDAAPEEILDQLPAGGWAASNTLVLADLSRLVDAPVGASRLTGAPLVATGVTTTPFGSSTIPWGDFQRLRASRFLQAFETRAKISRPPADDLDDPLAPVAEPGGSLPPAPLLTLDLYVHFVNLDSRKWILSKAAIPIVVDGTIYGTALLANPIARDKGMLLPSNGRMYGVSFSASIPSDQAVEFLRALSESETGPVFDFEHATELHLAPLGVKDFTLFPKSLESILSSTVPVTIDTPTTRHVFRVARGQGIAAALSMLGASPSNHVASLYIPSDPPRTGMVASLAGWDTGFWDLYWTGKLGAAALPAVFRLDLPVNDPLHFALSHRPPPAAALGAPFPAKQADGNAYPTLAAKTVASVYGSALWYAGKTNEALEVFAALPGPRSASWTGNLTASLRPSGEGLKLAAESYKQASDVSYAPGLAWYGGCLLRGAGVPANRAAALELLRAASRQGYHEGSALLALCLLRGIGSPVDVARAIPLLERAAWSGNATAQLALADFLFAKNDPEGVDWLAAAALSGSAKAQARYARILHKGEYGIPRNPQAAIDWFSRAAEQNEPSALVAMGEAYRSGAGVRRDPKRAASYFLHAAELGSRDGQTWAALCLLNGNGVPKDTTRAFKYLREAASHASAQAQYLLAVCLTSGFGGIEKDPQEAFSWFRSASTSVPAAHIFLGSAYLNGIGVQKDDLLAFEQFNKAADHNLPVGYLWVAYCYAHGIGCVANVDKARDWAARCGDSPAAREMLRALANQ